MEADVVEGQQEETSDAPATEVEKQPATPEPTNDAKNPRPEIYKALAIKLKKELVKSREELKKVSDDSRQECNTLRKLVEDLETNLTSERQSNVIEISTLDAQVKTLKSKLQSTEADYQSLQAEFEAYKVRASKVMQQTSFIQTSTNQTFGEERYKHMKNLNEEQTKQIAQLQALLLSSSKRNEELEGEISLLQSQIEAMKEKIQSVNSLEIKCERFLRENENLNIALKQYRLKLKEPSGSENLHTSECASQTVIDNSSLSASLKCDTNKGEEIKDSFAEKGDEQAAQQDELADDSRTRLSPSISVKDESQTNSSSSVDSSTYGYVHIKPNTFEIISRSSVLEDAQNQIDNLTRAYLDSESTNSLLTEQVTALKEEIRRLQRGTERMDLAENLEYLKNIVLKFLSLDSSQVEQRQRLIPVLSTILKLSPDEIQKLNSTLTPADRSSMASSLFNMIH